MPRLSLLYVATLCLLAEGADKDKSGYKSTLAPRLAYTGAFSFLHSHNKLPKVLLLLPKASESSAPETEDAGSASEGEAAEGADSAASAPQAAAGEPPSWFTSAAVHFKKGRDKSASFGFFDGDEGEKVAARFGISELPAHGKVIYCAVDGKDGGQFTVFDGALSEGAGKAVREVKAFVQLLVDSEVEGEPLPAFPPPDIPRKAAALSLTELTHDNLPTHCFGGAKSLCVIALLPAGSESCPTAVSELARRHRNDAVQFVWLKASRQSEFASAFELTSADLPRLVAVRTGKRNRFASLEGGLDSALMKSFMDRILGGDMTFRRLAELPELVPPYLMDDDKEEL